MSGALGDDATVLSQLGAVFEATGVDGESLGWANGSIVPTALTRGAAGTVSAGVHALFLGAAMEKAVEAIGLGDTRVSDTVELAVEMLHPLAVGAQYRMRGLIVLCSWQGAQAEGTIYNSDDRIVSRATATYLFHGGEEGAGAPVGVAQPEARGAREAGFEERRHVRDRRSGRPA